jgi:hypothetical protein
MILPPLPCLHNLVIYREDGRVYELSALPALSSAMEGGKCVFLPDRHRVEAGLQVN